MWTFSIPGLLLDADSELWLGFFKITRGLQNRKTLKKRRYISYRNLPSFTTPWSFPWKLGGLAESGRDTQHMHIIKSSWRKYSNVIILTSNNSSFQTDIWYFRQWSVKKQFGRFICIVGDTWFPKVYIIVCWHFLGVILRLTLCTQLHQWKTDVWHSLTTTPALCLV